MKPFFAACAAAAVFAYGVPAASAHSWYPQACCSLNDCEAIPSSGVSQMPKGFRVIYLSPRFGLIDEYIPMGTVKSSQDGGFHGCWRPKPMQPRTICFFAPMNV